MAKYDSLQQMICFLLKNSNVHICIHDLCGILRQELLHLEFPYTIHNAPFCREAKTTGKGLDLCLSCKLLANQKAIKTKSLFMGCCPSGLTEIALPVLYKEKVVCIIYIGNLITDSTKTRQKIMRTCKLTGVNAEKLTLLLSTSQKTENLDHYIQMATILRSYILLLLEQSPMPKQESSHWVIDAIRQHVALCYHQELTLSHLSKLYFLNEKYVGRLFKKETGQAFHDYLNQVRIEKASFALRNTKDTVLEISMQVGFKNVTYFNRVFKKFTGKTPMEYRTA